MPQTSLRSAESPLPAFSNAAPNGRSWDTAMVEILVKGRRGSKVIPLEDDRPLVIGRNGKLRIDDSQISRKHARVVRREDAWYVEDLGSTNGTYLNQVRVTRTARVRPGDCIRIGNTSMVVRRAPQAARDTAVLVRPRQESVLEIPNRIEPPQTELALASVRGGSATPNGWGPIILIAMTLALLISVFINVIAYARTASALSDIKTTAQERAAERDLDLVAALRSDLRKPPAGFAELAATVEGALRTRADQAASADAKRIDEFVELHRSTSDELAEIRRTLDGLATKLNRKPPPLPVPERQLISVTAGVDVPAPTFVSAAYPAPTDQSAAFSRIAHPNRVVSDVVFIIDASRGLAATLPDVLVQVRIARSELSARQTSRTFIARGQTVTEITDYSLASAQAGGDLAVADDPKQGEDASATSALGMALKLNPRRVHLFTDNLSDPAGELRNVLKTAASRGTPLSVTHFYTREFSEDLKSLARDHGGMYSFVGPG